VRNQSPESLQAKMADKSNWPYLRLMRQTFEEFIQLGLISNIDSDPFHHLDIGYHPNFAYLDYSCSPGGFTSAIFAHNRNARGEGIALPVEEGGAPLLLPQSFLKRIKIHHHHVTHFDLTGPNGAQILPPTYIPLPISTKFNLVILDAHRLNTGGQMLRKGETLRMKISQLLIAFQSTTPGGMVVIRLSLRSLDETVAIMYLLNLLFSNLNVHKPTIGHSSRGSFYAIAGGFQERSSDTELLDHVVDILRKTWWEASFGKAELDDTVDNPYEWWQEFVKSEDLPQLFGHKFIELITPVWIKQRDGLKAHFEKHGVTF
jgi:hypothetical protein